jgi:hypothetical protein
MNEKQTIDAGTRAIIDSGVARIAAAFEKAMDAACARIEALIAAPHQGPRNTTLA